MTIFRADLHIHSRHSRATSKNLSPRLLAAWAGLKGLDVLGSGDCTHPGWLAELKEALVPDKTGLFVLRDQAGLDREIPGLGWPDRPRPPVRFMLSAEISSIYKRGGRTRKVHNLVYLPSFEAAERLNARLAAIGNLASDGRPILGLDSRDLLETVLGTDPSAFLVPAHVWTPWFSLFGSQSGFDAVEECFGDLSGEIFALETGLSSDPEMNRLWSALDRFRLVSNSDAHSGEKLGRECNLFQGEIGYEPIRRALREPGRDGGARFLGTAEFFPEEGKYHLDGHRACDVVLDPRETRRLAGRCPVCGKPLTVGVLSRVLELADRAEPRYPAVGLAGPGGAGGDAGDRLPDLGERGFVSLIPLPELLAEIVGTRPGTKKVNEFLGRLLRRFPSELAVLMDAPADELARVSPPLGEAVARMRRGEVRRRPGFDGEYGVITVFDEAERREILGGRPLIAMPGAGAARRADDGTGPDRSRPGTPSADASEPSAPFGPPSPATPAGTTGEADAAPRYNAAQEAALAAGPGPVLVLAGPGTGKTHALIGRIARLLAAGEPAEAILAVTYTRRAAGELRERLAAGRGPGAPVPRADTLHALAFEHWTRTRGRAPALATEDAARQIFAAASGLAGARARAAWEGAALARERLADPGEHAEAARLYAERLAQAGLVDYAGLLEAWLADLRRDGPPAGLRHVLADEVQDLSPLQAAIVLALLPPDGAGLFAIGDPNQSIYSFRGALPDIRTLLTARWPKLIQIGLEENYRSSQAILDLADALPDRPVRLRARRDRPAEIVLFAAPTALREADWIAGRLRDLLGPTSHALMDGRADEGLAPGDCAVLVRTRALIPLLAQALERQGVPWSAPEEEAFWREPRAALLLGAVARRLGLGAPGEAAGPAAAVLDCPEAALARGPAGLAGALRDVPPFDPLFWEGRAWRRLARAYASQGGWAGLLAWIALESELDLVRERAETVRIMTLHAAKGLEFEVVCLPALEDGLLPFDEAVLAGERSGPPGPKESDGASRPPTARSADPAEERRLLYVGLTRARRRLLLSLAASREWRGRTLALPPSPCLDRLPARLLKKIVLKPKTTRQERQLPLL